MKPFFQKQVCDNRVRIFQTGTAFGSVHPKADDFSDQVERIKNYLGVSEIVAPRLEFTTDFFIVDDRDILIGGKDNEGHPVPGFYRTKEVYDGIILKVNMRMPLLIMNADCTVMTLLAANGDLAVLHLGFQNLIEQSGFSLVENTLDWFIAEGHKPEDLYAYIGGGARACCYGFDEAKKETYGRECFDSFIASVKEQYSEDVIPEIVHPPRKGGVGFDLPLIAKKQAEEKGVKQIEMEEECTSCAGLAEDDMIQKERFGTFYSHLREDSDMTEQRGYGFRNAFVVYK